MAKGLSKDNDQSINRVERRLWGPLFSQPHTAAASSSCSGISRSYDEESYLRSEYL
jgi:hypothetical protein